MCLASGLAAAVASAHGASRTYGGTSVALLLPVQRLLASILVIVTGCAVDPGTDDLTTDPATGGGKADGASDAPGRSFETYAAIATARGVTLSTTKPTVIGLRGLSLAGELHDTQASETFDDTIVVLTPDQHVIELAGSTHPWRKASSSVPDANGDGAGDVGMLRPGTYSIVPRDASQDILRQATFHVRTVAGSGNVPTWRDTDHDGVVSAAERAASEARGDLMSAVLFHVEADGAPAAVGCQVQSPESHKRFVTALGGRVAVQYVLVDAHDVDEL